MPSRMRSRPKANVVEGIMKPIREAANAITLKTYPA